MGGAQTIRAVIFDLWETLIDWDREENAALNARVATIAGDDFQARWSETPRYTGPVRDALAAAGVPAAVMDDVCALRRDHLRRALAPRPGAVDTLRELRRRGLRIGLITVCSEDVETLWPESEFAGLFDAEVFSSRIGLTKPDPRIYLACCRELGVEPRDAVFVGDGANDELAGARRVGMKAILIHRPGEGPLWPEVRGWNGPRVTSIPEVLEVFDRC
jgi:putative hydrolase of the HAD superfamily